MTAITNTARVAATTTVSNREAEKMLRDVAFVLKLTRRVKEEMAAERAQTQAPATATDRALVA